ncbi:MAG: hypothetical protein QW478_01685 [Candidatus Micrarchaeaceae archaeon]
MGTKQGLIPVKLTDKQINDILASIKAPPGIGNTARKVARENFLKNLKDILLTIKLVPTKEAFDYFKEQLLYHINTSYVAPGTSVGVHVGISLGGPITQLSMSSTHTAGTESGVASTFQVIRNFLSGSETNRNPQMYVYFKIPYKGKDLYEVEHVGTFQSILDMRHEFEQTTVKDVVLESEILTREEAMGEKIDELLKLFIILRPERFSNYQSRYPLTNVVKLKLDTYRMYTHKIIMKMIANAIEGNSEATVTCIWRSQFEGIMYIIIDELQQLKMAEEMKMEISHDAAILIFINNLILKKFDLMLIKGYEGITAIEPQEIRVMDGITVVRRSEKDPKNVIVFSSQRKIRWDGISLADIKRLIIACGYKVVSMNKEKAYLAVEYEADNFYDDLRKKVSNALDKKPEDRNEIEKKIAEYASYYMAVTKGINMSAIIWRDDVDLFRSSSNSPHDIFERLGIYACRTFYIFKFRQTLQNYSSSSYINGRHISLMFDSLTNLGIINSLSYTGINRRHVGVLATASYEQAMTTMMNGAIFGSIDLVDQVSPAIYVGAMPGHIGTSSVQVREDITVKPRDKPTKPTMDLITKMKSEVERKKLIESLKPVVLSEIKMTKQMQLTMLKPKIVENMERSEKLELYGDKVGVTNENLIKDFKLVLPGSGVKLRLPKIENTKFMPLSAINESNVVIENPPLPKKVSLPEELLVEIGEEKTEIPTRPLSPTISNVAEIEPLSPNIQKSSVPPINIQGLLSHLKEKK